MFNLGLTQRQDLLTVRDEEEDSESLSDTGMQQIQNLGSYVCS